MSFSAFHLPSYSTLSCNKSQKLRGRQRHVVRAGLGDSFRKISESLNFENWAPRSSRAWRLGIDINKEKGAAAKEQTSSASIDEDSIQALNSRISSAEPVRLPEDTNSSVDPTKRPEDSQLAASLNQRLKELSVASVDERSVSCTGESLRGLIEGKYGRTYDLSIVRRHIPGKTLVALNVMWTHLEQQSFPMSEEEYMDKLDTIAYYLRCTTSLPVVCDEATVARLKLGHIETRRPLPGSLDDSQIPIAFNQDQVVMDFLRQPAKSQRGLPARPVVGCAVSIRLDLPPAVIEEWFGK